VNESAQRSVPVDIVLTPNDGVPRSFLDGVEASIARSLKGGPLGSYILDAGHPSLDAEMVEIKCKWDVGTPLGDLPDRCEVNIDRDNHCDGCGWELWED